LRGLAGLLRGRLLRLLLCLLLAHRSLSTLLALPGGPGGGAHLGGVLHLIASVFLGDLIGHVVILVRLGFSLGRTRHRSGSRAARPSARLRLARRSLWSGTGVIARLLLGDTAAFSLRLRQRGLPFCRSRSGEKQDGKAKTQMNVRSIDRS